MSFLSNLFGRLSAGARGTDRFPPEVELCEKDAPGARLIAVARMFSLVQVRVCQKNMTEEQFRERFDVAYSYGPGGSERSGSSVHISFTSSDDFNQRLRDDKWYDARRDAFYKCAPRLKVTQTEFLWARINSTSRHFACEA